MTTKVDETIQDEGLEDEAIIVDIDDEDTLKPLHELKTDIRRLKQFILNVDARIEKYRRQIEQESNLGTETVDLVKQGLSVLEGKSKKVFDA
jgi:uncharacterized protein YbcC (UPF0753/DUF2309 family)